MKLRLLTPGPTPVPEEILLELAKPMYYHRSPEFREIFKEVNVGLKTVFATSQPVLTLTSSGTGSMEAALVNAVSPGGKVICLIAGRFGERWRHLCQVFGMNAICITVPWGEAVAPEQLEKALQDHPDASAVCTTLSETSTGVGHDMKAFGDIVARTPAVLIVDGVSGLGAMECRTDAWKLDLVCTGSQKALMMPPGLAFVSVSEKARTAISRNASPATFYFDLKKALKSLETLDTPYTPAHTLIRGLRLALARFTAEGMENVWARQTRHAAATRAGFQALGMTVFPKRPNSALTVMRLPDSIDGTAMLGRLEKEHGIKLANGQEHFKGTIFRIAHMGSIDAFDLLAALAGTERVLRGMGHPVELGSSLTAFQKTLVENAP